MEGLLLIALVGMTSVAAYLTGTRRLRLPGRGLWPAIARTLECTGMVAVFFAANLGLGAILILSFRTLTRSFVSLYVVNDTSLLIFSFLQSQAFSWWWKARATTPREAAGISCDTAS